MKNNEMFYEMIFKRKSFHIFKDIGRIVPEELEAIEAFYQSAQSLDADIKTAMRIVPSKETTCKRGQEYCILLYSEKKGGYLPNIGYIGQQLDLYLASRDIGALWFGIGKPSEPQYDGLDFVIMIAIAKMPAEKFRKDMFKSKRKPLEEIWCGDEYHEIGNIARFAPSACNTQPWMVETANGEFLVYRYKKPGKRGIMPADKVAYYNRIDIGIYLLFLEVCFTHQGMEFNRELFPDNASDDCEKVLIAKYRMKRDM
ncbi:MAG: nitroreductase [Lachnospiraceae bacterium]|nr:nitroreductase [Lachnospiraceae bacterium]